MFELKRTLLAVVLSAAVAVVLVPTATADEPKVKKPEQPTAEPQKTIIIQIDASKLPPDVLKELLKYSKASEPTKPGTKPEPTKPTEPQKPGKSGTEPAKPGTKPEPTKTVKSISLSDAIAIAEKASQGTVVKAAREEEDGKVQFKLDVQDGKGNKSKVTLDTSGKLIGTEKKGEDEKGKGKKKKDD